MAGIPGLESIIPSGGASTMLTVVKMVFYGIVIGGGVMVAIWFLSYNIKVEIMERNGAGFVSRWEKARLKKDKNNPGVFLFELMRDKRWVKAPLDKNFITMEKKAMGRVGMLVRMAEDDQGRLQPMRPTAHGDVVKWTGWGNNAMEFTTRGAKEVLDRFKEGDFWSKYGMLVQMGLFFLLFVMVLVLFRELSSINEGLSNVADALRSAAEMYNAAYTPGSANVTQIITTG